MEEDNYLGYYRIPTELLKTSSEKSKEKLYLMIKDMYEEVKIHTDFSRVLMSPITKNSGTKLCEDVIFYAY